MKTIFLVATIFVLCVSYAVGQGKLLTSDPLTGLPLTPATDSGMNFGNAPTQMPDGNVCKSKMQAEFYSLYKTKVDATTAWYASHLSGFKKFQGYDSKRAQVIFYNPDRTILVIVTGSLGAQGENTEAYSVSYQRYQPGLSEKTITTLTQGKIVCQ